MRGLGSGFGRIVAPAFVLGLLAALMCATSAFGLTNSGTVLDIGAGESLSLDGTHTYTTSVWVHDGGVLYIGGTGSLALQSPAITVGAGSAIIGTATGADGTGGTLVLECDVLNVSGSVVSNGMNAPDGLSPGRHGGSITVRARSSVAFGAGLISAAGGWNFTNVGDGGDGGTITAVTPQFIASAGTTVTVDGGSPFHYSTINPGGDGGDAGTISLDTGSLDLDGVVSAEGGDGASGPASYTPGDGGDGGTVSIIYANEPGSSGTISVAGGAPGVNGGTSGTAGTAGTITRTQRMNAPYSPAATIDGVMDWTTNEYYRSWRTGPCGDNLTYVSVHEDGYALYVGVSHLGTTGGIVVLFFDPNSNGGSTPQTDDFQLTISDIGTLYEAVGNGASWAISTPTGWTGARGTPSSPTRRDYEYRIPFAKLGLTAGTARNLKMGVLWQRITDNAQFYWPATANQGVPNTWQVLTSEDSWTLAGNTPPGSWTGFVPSAINSLTPTAGITCSDAVGGLDVSTAEYRYSTNTGSTWSGWLSASCTGGDGTTAPQRLTTPALPLVVGMTPNQVQFRVADMGGYLATSPAYTVGVDTTVPTPWTDLQPSGVVANTLTPNCTAKIKDAVSGLNVASAQYDYSTNGGASWYGPFPAACTGTSGTTATQTVTAYAVPFNQASTTLNRVRFHISDVAGNSTTSSPLTVQITATPDGLPANGDFELGTVGGLPSLWQSQTTTSGPGTGTSSFTCQLISSARFHGLQSVQGRAYRNPDVTDLQLGADTTLIMSGPADFTGSDTIDLAMRDCTTGGDTRYWSYNLSISLLMSDGTTTQTAPLYSQIRSGNTDTYDNRIGTATGADGTTWSIYRVAIPPALDHSRMRVAMNWHVDGNPAYLGTAISIESKIDWIRVVDVVPPRSSASIGGSAWGDDLTREVSFTATDYVGLASVQLWKRLDTGSGFGPWTQDQSRSALGTSTVGTFTTDTLLEGRYEFYTRAVDSSGNVEAAPGAADAWCAVDRTAPAFGNLTPSGWISDLTPSVTVDVRDAGAGLGLTPQVVGSLPEHTKSILCAEYGTTVYTGAYSTLFALDIANPIAPAEAAAIDLHADITDLAVDPDRPWLYATLGSGGLATFDTLDPLKPEVVGTTEELGDLRLAAASTGLSTPLVFAASSADLWILDASRPESKMPVLSRTELPGICDMAFHEGLLYVTTTDQAVWTVDPHHPEEPVVTEGPAIVGNTYMAFEGSLLYLADGNASIMVYDVSRAPDAWPAVTPDPIGHLLYSLPSSLRVSGDRLYAILEGGDVPVIDVGTPSAPTILRQLDGGAGGLTRTIALLDHTAVTMNVDAGLKVWQTAEPVYRWSSDGGASWSDWFAAQRSYSEGTNATQTLTATRAEFDSDSGTQNVVEFATADSLARLGSSGALPLCIDTTGPRVMGPMSASHSNPASWYPATTVNVSWGAYADLSGIVGYAHGWDDTSGTVLPSVVTTTAMMAARTGAIEGVHYFHVRPVDAAGNWGTTAHLAYQVDTNPPTAPTGLSVTPTSSSTNSFSANWTNPAQTYAPLDACYYKLDAAPTSSTDGTLVAGPPTSISGITASSEGTHTLYVWLRDAAGNVNHANRASATFVYDASAPGAPAISSSTHLSESTWYSTSPALLSWAATDSVSAIDGYSWSFDSDPSGEPDYLSDGTTPAASYNRPGDGVYYFHVRARNAVGLWGATSTYTIRWDTSAPSGTMSVNNDSIATSQTAVTVNSSVTDLTTMTMRASTSGGATWTASVPYSTTMAVDLPAGDGEKTVTVEYTDSLSHMSSLNDTIILDTAAPVGGFVLNGNDADTTSTVVTATASVSDLTALEMRYSVNGGSTWTAWEPYAVTKTLTLPAVDGTATVWARFRDQVGHVLETSDTIVLDLTTEMDRIAGDNRYETAAMVSASNFPAGTCDYVVVATGAQFPDALGAAGLAGSYKCPLLLTDPKSLPTAIRNEIVRCGATDCFIIGSTAAVTDAVKSAIDAIPGMNTPVRLQGTNRYETAAAVAHQIATHEGPGFSRRAFIARGDNFADALAASPLAYSTSSPVLLVQTTALPAATRNAILSLGITDVMIAGSDKAVSNSVKNQIDALSGVNTPVRVSGADRYATAAAVATYGVDQGWATWEFLGIATGQNFPDALGGGAACGSHGGVLLLTSSTALSTPCRSAIVAHADDIGTVQVFGGTSALSTGVYNQILGLVQ